MILSVLIVLVTPTMAIACYMLRGWDGVAFALGVFLLMCSAMLHVFRARR